MFERLAQHGDRLAAEHAARRRDRIAARLREAMPGLAISREGETVALTGRGLVRQYGRSAALRWRIAEASHER